MRKALKTLALFFFFSLMFSACAGPGSDAPPEGCGEEALTATRTHSEEDGHQLVVTLPASYGIKADRIAIVDASDGSDVSKSFSLHSRDVSGCTTTYTYNFSTASGRLNVEVYVLNERGGYWSKWGKVTVN